MNERVLIVPIATNDWWAPIARWLLESRFNHIFILFEDRTLGGWWARESGRKGVHIVPAERSSLTRVKYVEYHEYREPLILALQVARGTVGADYDRRGLLSNIVRLLLWKFFKIRWSRPSHNKDDFTCYEDSMEVLNSYPVQGLSVLEPHKAMPGEIRDFIVDSPNFDEVENPLLGE